MKKINERENKRRFLQAVGCLGKNIFGRLEPLAEAVGGSVQEIRIRCERPLAAVCPQRTYYLKRDGSLCETVPESPEEYGKFFCPSREEISACFAAMCRYSVYSRQNEIINGFVTLRGGHRAGICGTAVTGADGRVVNIRDLTTINVRISRTHRGCGEGLFARLRGNTGGVLVCGAPCSGKTTVLRDLARLLSTEGGRNVALIDERGELAACVGGRLQNDVGLCDVYDGCPKSEAMLWALRSMAPDDIICDEIGCDADIRAVEQALNSGVRIIASAHCFGEHEFVRRKGMAQLLKTGAFSSIAFLSSRAHSGEIVKFSGVGEVLGS